MADTFLKTKTEKIELATFFIGNSLYGIDILHIQEINRNVGITYVPLSSEYVKGILNLRGRIVTVIDLGKKLGLTPVKSTKNMRNIIVDINDEPIGLLVDSISDVLSADAAGIESAPVNIGGVQGIYFKGVLKTPGHLIGVLDIEKILLHE